MIFNKEFCKTVENYVDLNKLDDLDRGTLVKVLNPTEHYWVKLQDGWYNTQPEVLKGINKLEFKPKTVLGKIIKFLQKYEK